MARVRARVRGRPCAAPTQLHCQCQEARAPVDRSMQLIQRLQVLVVGLLLLQCAPRDASSLKLCIQEGCLRHASYGAADVRRRVACSLHKAANHVYLIGQLCEFGNGTAVPCRRRGSYGMIGGYGRFCNTHRQLGMVHLQSRKCQTTGCTKQPIFGVVNSTRPLFCRQHKGEAHVDVVNRRCKLCSRQGVFGDPGTRTSMLPRHRQGSRVAELFCREHSLESHRNLLSKRCRADGCTKQPYFGDPATRIPLWCNTHKASGHQDVKNRRCYHPHGCTRHPAYGDASTGLASYCFRHKAPAHVLILNSRYSSS